MTRRIFDLDISIDQLTKIEVFNNFKKLCESYGITLFEKPQAQMCFIDNCLYLQQDGIKFSLNWFSDLKRHLNNGYALSKEPLAKALGIKKTNSLTILDATLGTGKDAILLLSFGAKLICFERNPSVFCLCLDALRRARELAQKENLFQIFFDNLEIRMGELKDELQNIIQFDAIYYDPMYPEKRKSALARKEMQIFHEVVGSDSDIENQIIILMSAKKKLVLKRPLKSQVLFKPSSSICGKTTRYDLYLKS